jgi:small subunit ribosomal protein S9
MPSDSNATPRVSNPAFAPAATADAGAAPAAPAAAPRPIRKRGELKSGWYWGTGRRKTAVARVRLRPAATEGQGIVKVQIGADKFKTIEQYFAEERDRNDCYAPLKATNTFGKLDVIVRLNGGGYMGQAGAVLLGVTRALREYDPSLEDIFRGNGMLTRDSRDVERKKYGQAGARRRFQFSKR